MDSSFDMRPVVPDGQSVPEPSAGSRWFSNAGAAVVIAVAVGGIWWWSNRGRLPAFGELRHWAQQPAANGHNTDGGGVASTDDSGETPGVGERTTSGVRSPSAGGDSHAGETGTQSASDSSDDPKINLTETSWQDPFGRQFWQGSGWDFDGRAMHSSGADPATATFRRTYRKLTIECRIAPVGEPKTFQIQLFAPETDALLQAEFTKDAVVVSSDIQDEEKVIRRRAYKVPFAAAKPIRIRLTATGNRVIIFCGGQLVLRCNQPAEQSGKPIRLSLRSVGGGFRITSLRLEGE